jgi:hypothetical protein
MESAALTGPYLNGGAQERLASPKTAAHHVLRTSDFEDTRGAMDSSWNHHRACFVLFEHDLFKKNRWRLFFGSCRFEIAGSRKASFDRKASELNPIKGSPHQRRSR